MTPLVTYRIPLLDIKVSTNKIYAGTHWSKRNALKDSVTRYAGLFCRPILKIESYPVEVRYRFVFVSRPLDTLNTAYMAKMFEDAFRSLGILADDDPAHVARSILEVRVAGRPTKSKGADSARAQAHEKNEDHLIISIYPYATDTSRS